MKTIIYLIRHSEPIKDYLTYDVFDDTKIIQKDKMLVLSVNGEKIAKKHSKLNIFKKIDKIYSSEYARCVSTAKYLADNNNLKIHIDTRLGERIHGINDNPNDKALIEMQIKDANYKLTNGESRNEVYDRFDTCINEIIKKNKGKKICIYTHCVAITYYLTKYCDIKFLKYFKYNNETIFNAKWNYLDTFKLTFDEFDLIDLEYIKKEI